MRLQEWRPRESGASIVVALERAWSNLPASREASTAADQLPNEPTGRRIRVTEQLSIEIVRRYLAGQPSRLVAEQLGVSKSTVLKVLNRKQVPVRPVGSRY